jgi:hypothetical protein
VNQEITFDFTKMGLIARKKKKKKSRKESPSITGIVTYHTGAVSPHNFLANVSPTWDSFLA